MMNWRLWTLGGADYGNIIWPVGVSPWIKQSILKIGI